MGQDQLTARPGIIPALFSVFTSEKHQRVLQEKENAVLIGTAVEELIRHHPSLKNAVMDAIKLTMGKIEELGNAYVPPAEHRHWYMIQAVTPAEPAPASGDIDVDMAAATGSESTVTAQAAADLLQSSEELSRNHENAVVSYLDVFGKVCCRTGRWCVRSKRLILSLVPGGLLPTRTTLSRLHL